MANQELSLDDIADLYEGLAARLARELIDCEDDSQLHGPCRALRIRQLEVCAARLAYSNVAERFPEIEDWIEEPADPADPHLTTEEEDPLLRGAWAVLHERLPAFTLLANFGFHEMDRVMKETEHPDLDKDPTHRTSRFFTARPRLLALGFVGEWSAWTAPASREQAD